MKSLLYVILVALLGLVSLLAQSEERELDSRLVPELNGVPLIVTHAEGEFDESQMARKGLDSIIEKWQAGPTIVLYSQKKATGIYLRPSSKAQFIYSAAGEFYGRYHTNEVVLAGGFLGYDPMSAGCMTSTIADVIQFHQEDRPGEEIIIHIIADTTYLYDQSLKLTPKNFHKIFFLNRDMFYPKKSSIGFGVLPPVPGHESTKWPPSVDDLPPQLVSRYEKLIVNQRQGHLNSVTKYKYSFHFDYNGEIRPKLKFGEGELKVHFKIWKTLDRFKLYRKLQRSCRDSVS